MLQQRRTRREVLGGLCALVLGGLGGWRVAGAASAACPAGSLGGPSPTPSPLGHQHGSSAGGPPNGPVDPTVNGFDPTRLLTAWDEGRVSWLPTGQRIREYHLVAQDRVITVAPGWTFAAWTYNGQVPGPTLRCTAGDRVRVTFHNQGSLPHSIHFHGQHPPDQDGLTAIQPGEQTVYEFTARPAGLHLYHCHVAPLAEHVQRGLYGVLIVDPTPPRPPAREVVMMLNAFDLNGDGENEVYAVNTVAFHFWHHPIQVQVGELIRVYVVNITEFDPINSFHLHAGMFQVYRTGTSRIPHEFTDNVVMGQGERHILEFTLDDPGRYLFHAHQAEFTDRGWVGWFEAAPAQ